MKGRHLGLIAGGAGALLVLVSAIYFIADLTAGKPDRPLFSPKWELCNIGDTCVAVPAPCGEWQPVNARYEKDAAAYYEHLIRIVDTEMICVRANMSTRKPQAFCVSGVCGLAQ